MKDGGDRAMECMAEAQRKGKLIARTQVDFAGQGDIAIECCSKLPGQPKMRSEVLPAVGRSHVAARTTHERRRRRHRQPCALFVSSQKTAPGNPRDITVITPAANFEMRREERVYVQPAQPCGVSFQARVDQHAWLMRIANHLHYQPIAAVQVSIDNAHAQPMLTEVLDAGFLVAMGVVKKRLTVGDEELQVANLRPVYSRIINFTDYTVRDCEPYAA